jgi:hypothetical protein
MGREDPAPWPDGVSVAVEERGARPWDPRSGEVEDASGLCREELELPDLLGQAEKLLMGGAKPSLDGGPVGPRARCKAADTGILLSGGSEDTGPLTK